MAKIKGGFTIWARRLLGSSVFYWKPAIWFKIWFFIVNRVNYCDTRLFPRGEGFMTYKEIGDDTRASKNQIDHFMRWAKKERMLATRKTTRGMVVTVLQYQHYQDPANYESDTKSEIKAKQARHRSDTISKENKKDKNIKNNTYSVSFDLFWNLYPSKVDKKKAYQLWKTIKPEAYPLIMKSVEVQKESDQWHRGYVPHPTTWLRNERWNDEMKPQEHIEVIDLR